MEVFEAIRTLLAVREFKDTPVPQDAVRRIVEAGWLTGSAKNEQPWHFVVVQDRPTIAELGRRLSSGPYTAQAPLAIAVGVDDTRFAVSDASRAIHSMMLAGWGEGLGSNWVGFGGLDSVRDLLGFPAGVDVLAVLPFGYPVKEIGKGKKRRKPLADVVHRERFGQPF